MDVYAVSYSRTQSYNSLIFTMQGGFNAIKYMGMLMSRDKLDLGVVLELVEVINKSYFQCQNVITIMEDIFTRQKSGRIYQAIQILEYLVKNGNKNFHQAANKESFQNKLMSLLKRVRGKSSFLKDIRSNTQNWNKIEAKTLYLIQLWYDAFILEENVYNHIINSYKTLRKQGIMFPPRSINEKNILFVQTSSPILQNIEDIARQDHQRFSKQLKNMGLQKISNKMELIQTEQIKKQKTRKIDIDQISQRIAIVRSNSFEGKQMIKLVQQIKKDLQYGQVIPSEKIYWKDIKEAAQILIEEWQQANSQMIKAYQREYLESKMGKKTSVEKEEQDEFGQFANSQSTKTNVKEQITKKEPQVNLLDL